MSNGTIGLAYSSGTTNGFVNGSRHTVGGVWTASVSNMQHKRDGANYGTLSTAAAFPSGMPNSTLGVRIGAANDGTFLVNGNVYAMRLYVGGTLVASPDFTKMVAGQTQVTDGQGNMWVLKGAAAVANPVINNTPATVSNWLLGGGIALPTNVSPIYVAGMALAWLGTTNSISSPVNPTLGGVYQPWLMITDETFGQTVYPASTVDTIPQGPPKVVCSWSTRGNAVDVTSTAFQRSPGNIPWEPPRTQHVYMYPQRINYVPNPSFEDLSGSNGGNFGWRAKGTMTRLPGGVDNANNNYGHIVGTRLESVPIPLSSRFTTVSAYVRSAGATYVQLGIATYGTDWNQTGDRLSAHLPVVDTWTRLSYVVQVPDDMSGCGFLCVSDGNFDIDLVMMEPSADVNDYFAGDSQTGILGDFGWQGVTHQSLSFWYNNKYLVGARLFGTYTTGLVPKTGLVYDWVPAGTSISTHWDVLNPQDTKQPMADFGSRVIP